MLGLRDYLECELSRQVELAKEKNNEEEYALISLPSAIYIFNANAIICRIRVLLEVERYCGVP